MDDGLQQRIADWDGMGVLCRRDEASGSWIFIALHDATLGRPTGGTRLKSYPAPSDALRDAMRLAEGMTHKWAALDFDCGGGKGVIAVPEAIDAAGRERALRVYGELIQALGGGFATGRDLGTTDADMLLLSGITEHVHGVDRQRGTVRDPGPFTAAGVFAALESTVERLDGRPGLAGRRVLVQGLGAVGLPLARRLAAAQVELLVSDVDATRADAVAAELSAASVAAAAVYDTPCDVYAPCAVGATLNAETIPRLACSAVVGSANNQLREGADAERLHRRRVLYAPDFIANGGGALAFGLIHRGAHDERDLFRRVDSIRDSLGEVLDEARRHDESPLAAARRRVQRALARGVS